MQIRKLDGNDSRLLEGFFRAIPEGDRTFFKEDLSDADVMRSLVNDSRGLRMIAQGDGGAIEGYVAVLPGISLSKHVGEVRLLVAAERRRAGIGRELARRALIDAIRELGLRKLFVEVVAEQEAAIRMFQKLGFVAEAILRDHLCDRAGKLQDVVLLAHFVDENWAGMKTLGLDRELA